MGRRGDVNEQGRRSCRGAREERWGAAEELQGSCRGAGSSGDMYLKGGI